MTGEGDEDRRGRRQDPEQDRDGQRVPPPFGGADPLFVVPDLFAGPLV